MALKTTDTEKGKKMRIEDIAHICHEINRTYCHEIGDDSQPPWDDAPYWQRESAINGVAFHLNHPEAKPSDSHENWLKFKLADGWKYGPVKDPDKKEHPCCVPYEKLPIEQQIKDELFSNIVRILRPLWEVKHGCMVNN